jgi:drug/metabolite transporter (DMT)-like permease
MEKKYAYIVMVLATFLYNLQPLLLKTVKVSFIYQVISLCLGILVPSFVVLVYHNSKLPPNDRFDFTSLITNKNRLLYGIISCVYLYNVYYGFKMLPMSISLPLFMLFPITIMITQSIINKVPISFHQIIGSAVTILGILITCFEKNKSGLSKKAIVIMLFGTIIFGLGWTLLQVTPERTFLIEDAQYMVEQDNKHEDFIKANIDILQTAFVPLVFSIIMLLLMGSGLFKGNKQFGKLQNVLLGEKFDKIMLIKLICVSLVLSYTYNILYFEAYNALDSSIYAALENLEVVFGMLIGYFVLNEKVGIRKIGGASAVIGGILISIYGDKLDSSITKFKFKP